MTFMTCVTHSEAAAQGAERHGSPSLSTPSLVALAFSSDSSHAAYAVRRSQRLPRDGTSEDACVVYVARTHVEAAHTDGSTRNNSSPPTSGTATADVPSSGAITEFSQWLVTQVLTGGHEAPITALAWHPRTSALLSVSADGAACVWVPQSNNGGDAATAYQLSPVPQLVMLSAEVRLSPTCAAWSAGGKKLYIGTSGGTVAVGRYDVRQKWWICRLMDTAPTPPPLSSDGGGGAVVAVRAAAVTSLVAHPHDNTRVAVTSLDGVVQVRSTYVKSVDGARSAVHCDHDDASRGGEDGAEAAPALPPSPFGHGYFSHRLSCWVHDADWSPSGQQLAVVAHDSTLHVWRWPVDSPCTPTHTAVPLRQLPLTRCAFLAESLLAAACFDGFVYAFACAGGAAVSSGQGSEAWRLVQPHTPLGTVMSPHDTAAAATSAAHNSDSPSTTTQSQGRVPGHCDPSTAVLVDVAPMAKSVRQRARELLERGHAAVAWKRLATVTGDDGTHAAATVAPAQPVRAPHRSPIHLLVRVPPPPAALWVESTVVSAGHDGRVHLWRVGTATPPPRGGTAS